MKYLTEQITNYDLEDKESSYYEVEVPTKDGTEFLEIEYKTILKDFNIIKFGYCCEEKGFYYPLFIQNKNEEDFKPIILSSNCIFELTPSTVEKDAEEALEKQVIITGIKVPVGIKFTLDYTRIE